MFTLGDKTVIGIFLLASIFSIFILPVAQGGSGTSAKVIHNGKSLVLDLSKDREFQIKGGKEQCLLEIKRGQIRVKRSGCPDKICMSKGWINKAGENIICLPHRVFVEITGQADIDANIR